jgi:hypothetical protein
VGADFGLVGLDRRFRELPEAAVDGCGRVRPNKVSVAGARVLYARSPRDVRTLVNGYAGPRLRAAQVAAGGTVRRLPIGPEGTFVYALRGYPEDIGVVLRLRFADGHAERYPLGTDRQVVLDPLGGHAWVTLGESIEGGSDECVTFQWAREYPNLPVSPAACGSLGDVRRPRGWFFAVRRIHDQQRWTIGPRTAVWGKAGEDVRRVVVVSPAGRRELTVIPGGRFLAVYPGSVAAGSLRVEITTRDGKVHVERGNTNLLKGPRR